jgi:heparanase 1
MHRQRPILVCVYVLDYVVRRHFCSDYWTSVLFKQLVGTRVLSVANSTQLGRTLRVYAFCSRNITGGVVVAAININTTPQNFDFLDFPVYPRLEYQLTAPGGNMSSANINLNGNTLFASDTGALPNLSPVQYDTNLPIMMGPLSYGYFVFPEANAPACM